MFLFDDSESFEEWYESELPEGFTLPTEDEWEYLYSAGARTLFPWGEEIDESIRLRHVSGSAETGNSGLYPLELPNAFGLLFPGDPYKRSWFSHRTASQVKAATAAAICTAARVSLSGISQPRLLSAILMKLSWIGRI